jgi:dihydropyrimidinase
MVVDLVVRNGIVATPRGRFHGGVAVEGERIVALGPDATLPLAHRVIDARARYVVPGLIDAHVHMASEEDPSIAEGLRANMPRETEGALYGGVTTFGHFVGMRDEPLLPNIRATVEHGNRWSHVDYFLHAIVGDEKHFDELPAVWAEGVTSFKHFFNAYRARPGEELSWLGGPSDAGMLYRSLRFCAERGHPGVVVVHCEDIDLIVYLESLVKATGRRDLGAWSEARPSAAESARVAMAIQLAALAGAPLYVAHLSTAEAADLVAAARTRGQSVWAEVTPHHLTHTGDMEAEIGCWGKVNPPLRAARDTERLWRAFHDGGVTCLGSDHGTGAAPARRRRRTEGNTRTSGRPGPVTAGGWSTSCRS